jgi:hypothetical protein
VSWLCVIADSQKKVAFKLFPDEEGRGGTPAMRLLVGGWTGGNLLKKLASLYFS